MECIPETQFVMRSKIHLAVLLHLWCKCEREEDYCQFELILIYACFMEDPVSNPGRGKKTAIEQKYFKSNNTGEQTYVHTDYSQILYHCATLFHEDLHIYICVYSSNLLPSNRVISSLEGKFGIGG